MTPYVVLLVAAGALGLLLCEYKPDKKKEYLFLILIAVIMLAFPILRGENVGVDYNFTYRKYFLRVCREDKMSFLFSPKNVARSEPLFVLLNMAVSLFTQEPMVFYAITGVLIVALRLIFIAKYSPKPWISVFMYIALGFFSYSMCTTRQELGISMAMFALPHLLNRKPAPFFAIMAAAGLMHNSLFMLMPLYFAVLLPPSNKLVLGLYAVGMAVVLMFSRELIALFVRLFPRFDLYSDGNYFLQGRDINTVVIWIALLALIVLFYKRLIGRDPRNMMLFNIYLFGTLIMSMTVNVFLYQRVALMMLPFSVILIAEVMASLDFRESAALASAKGVPSNKLAALKKKAGDDKRMYYSILALFAFLAVLEFFFLLYANRLNLVPYQTFWM